MPVPREVLIDCLKVGNCLRVIAVDVATGTEVTFQAPLVAARATIQRIAADKLKYAMERRKGLDSRR